MVSSVQEVSSEQLLKAAAVVEEQLDQQMERMDHLGEDDLEAIRRRRMEEIKKKQLEKQKCLLKGHGEYEEFPDERSFFEATKKSSRFVAHFFRQSTDRCKIVDMHLKGIASQHVETRFVRVNVEKVLFIRFKALMRQLGKGKSSKKTIRGKDDEDFDDDW